MDLSAFKDGLEVIVPNPIKILVPSTGYPRPTATWSFGDKVLELKLQRQEFPWRSSVKISPCNAGGAGFISG